MTRPKADVRPVMGSDVPLYHQIYLQLRSEIVDGGWAGRGDFPGELELARQFGVSVITSRKALDRLAEDRYIERSRGKRPRVVHTAEPGRHDEIPDIIQTRLGEPRAFSYQVLARGISIVPGEACEAFGVPPGTRLWSCSRLRSFRGRPHSVTLNVQRETLGTALTLAELQKFPMTHLLRQRGIRFSRMTRRIGTVLAPAQVGRHLGLSLSEPTLVYSFAHHDVDDTIVQWVRIWVRPDEPSPEEVFNYTTGTWSMSSTM